MKMATFWESFLVKNPLNMRSKINANIDAEKVWTIMKKQVRKSDEKSTENMMVSDGAEPRFALYTCVIIHFGGFRKRKKT